MGSTRGLVLRAWLAALFFSGPALAAGESNPAPSPSESGGLTTEADAAWRAGKLAEAADLFVRARAAAPLDVNPARGACRLALEVGDYKVAREACERTFLMGGTPEDMRNQVAAFANDPGLASMDEMARAIVLTEAARRNGPGQPWGYLAQAEMATRLGDREMLDSALAELQRVAPGDEHTLRALARAKTPASLWTWFGRIAFVLFLLVTGGHALSRWKRSGSQRAASRAAAALTVMLVLLTCRGAHAEGPEQIGPLPIDDARPDKSVPTPEQQMQNPLNFGYFLQDLLAKAEDAAKRGDHSAAARYYGALTKAVPGRALAYGKECEELVASGDRKLALTACHEALFKEGVTVGDYTRYFKLVLSKVGPVSDHDRQDLEAVFTHLESAPAGLVTAQTGRCELAVRSKDQPALEACTSALAKAAPDDPATISFQWALAVQRHEVVSAFKLIGRAGVAGMAESGLNEMEKTTWGLVWRVAGRALLWVPIAAIVFALVRRLTRRSAGNRDVPMSGAADRS